jgi:hypothetical protein
MDRAVPRRIAQTRNCNTRSTDDCGKNEIAGERERREKRKKSNWLCSGLQAKSHQRYNWKSNETWNEIMTTVQKEGRQQNVVSDDGAPVSVSSPSVRWRENWILVRMFTAIHITTTFEWKQTNHTLIRAKIASSKVRNPPLSTEAKNICV